MSVEGLDFDSTTRQASLDLGLVGNGTFGALIDKSANVVWACYPSFDGDPSFCALLSPKSGGGQWSIEVDDTVSIHQEYLSNTAVLRTVIEDSRGGKVEVTDFCPRWRHFGRIYKPVMLIRKIRPLAGTPRIRVRLQPLAEWGARVPERTWGSNHMRWMLPEHVMRLTTDAPLRLLRDELPFVLDRELRFVLGPDETLTQPISGFVQDAEERTLYYWREWTRYLSIPLEWQDAVIRSAITLKLCQYEDTGGIIAALTTSIPEAPGTSRNWDYRYCWLRDAAFVVRVLNRLGATRTMEEYIRYAFNLAVGEETQLQPVYGIGFETELHEDEMPALAGYRGMGPVRRGNLAWKQVQHDVYGSVVLASTQLFFDHRLDRRGDVATLERLEPLGERAWETHDQPDAGLWEFRGRSAVHTYSSMMCWAACDRLAKVSTHFGLDEKAKRWRDRADTIRATVLERAWNADLGHFADAFDGERLDASLLLMADFGFIAPDDPRFIATVEACGRDLRRGHGVFRYVAPDDFGAPETTFTICTFWYIEALAMIGRRDEARALFESVLERRNHLGLLSEDMAVEDGALWGNFPQTYSHVGLIGAAVQLSRPWQEAT